MFRAPVATLSPEVGAPAGSGKMDVTATELPMGQLVNEEPIFYQDGMPGRTIRFILDVEIKDDSELPNGLFFTGGPRYEHTGLENKKKMNAFVPHGISGRELQTALHEEYLRRVGEYYHRDQTQPSSASSYQRVDPNSVASQPNLRKAKVLSKIFVRIDHRGGPLNLENPVQAGKDYEAVALVLFVPISNCCLIS